MRTVNCIPYNWAYINGGCGLAMLHCMYIQSYLRSHFLSFLCALSYSKGVFLLTTKIMFVPVKQMFSVNTCSRILTVPQGSERARDNVK